MYTDGKKKTDILHTLYDAVTIFIFSPSVKIALVIQSCSVNFMLKSAGSIPRQCPR